MSMDDMMSFRTAYLRIVARSWSDPVFRSMLPGLSHDSLVTLLASLGHRWTWGGLKLELGVEGPLWDPVDTGGWFGHGASTITLALPLDRSSVENFSRNQARALADYYRHRVTLFGLPQDNPPPAGGARIAQGYDTNLGNFDAFFDFGGVILRAVALAWKRDDFKADLETNGVTALEKWFGFHSAWDLQMAFQTDTTARWKENLSDWDVTTLTRNTLRLEVPQAPSDADIQPIAITAYNETGAAYPFTCCD